MSLCSQSKGPLLNELQEERRICKHSREVRCFLQSPHVNYAM